MKLFSILLASAACAVAPTAQGAAPVVESARISSGLVRTSVEGVDVIAYHTGVKDVVTLRGSLAGGDIQSPASNPAVAKLTAMMLDKGTKTLDKYAITTRLEAVGADLGFGAGEVVTEFSAKCLSKDLPLVIELLAEQLRNPVFSSEELAKLKKQVATGLKRRLESPDFRASDAFSRALYPEGHPNRRSTPEAFLAAVEATRVEDLQAFHKSHYGPQGMVIVVVGDVDPVQLQTEVGKAFAGWRGGSDIPAITKAPATRVGEQVVFMAEKPSVSIILGQTTGLHHSDPDALPLRVATAILGSGFTGRLMSTVRDKEGLTYGIGAGVSGDTFVDGQWTISATFAPAMLAQGINSSRRELLKWYTQGVSADELKRRKTNLVGTFKVGLATTGGLAGQILATVQRGYPMSWLDEYPSRVEALTLEQVNSVIRRRLNPDTMFLVKAGSVPEAKP